MSENTTEGEEPIMCSKCNQVFKTDSEYIQHYDEKHKPKEADEEEEEEQG